MGDTGTLRLELIDVHGNRLDEQVDINLFNQGLSEKLGFRGLDASKVIEISGLHADTEGIYRMEIDPRAYLPVNRFVSVNSNGGTSLQVPFPVDHNKVLRVNFPQYAALTDPARNLLTASNQVLAFAGLSSEPLYSALDDLRRAGMLNIFAKSGRTRFSNQRSVMEYFLSLRELRQDRFFVNVQEELHDQTLNSVAGGLFYAVDDSLHSAPPGFEQVDSYKTDDHYGNLQLTFSRNGDIWVADVDIDDAAGF